MAQEMCRNWSDFCTKF